MCVSKVELHGYSLQATFSPPLGALCPRGTVWAEVSVSGLTAVQRQMRLQCCQELPVAAYATRSPSLGVLTDCRQYFRGVHRSTAWVPVSEIHLSFTLVLLPILDKPFPGKSCRIALVMPGWLIAQESMMHRHFAPLAASEAVPGSPVVTGVSP